ncbi:MAG TPA: protein kinase [Candidatus Polarisedimenticolia bacterium]|jgi:Tol biopolymer transport system component
MARTLQPTNLISHYRVVSPLGAGGMGEVYLAHDQNLERNVALKILPPQLVRNEERVRRFILEAKSASSLSHPHIVTIYEIGQDRVRTSDVDEAPSDASDPVHFIAMELISGETLKDKIHHEKTELRTLLGYMAQVADGLAKAHAAGIVHRDLKPSNIMVTKDGYAKVLDFGLAKLTEKQAAGPDATSAPTEMGDLTGGGAVVGTAGYMSPEQIRGKVVDHRSDIFSFGCILYEAATRQRPFSADTDVETMHKILNEKPTAVEELNPAAPAEVRRLIRRCLAKNADQRFQSIKDIAIELREIVEEYDTLSASTGSGSSIAPSGVAPPPRRTGLIAAIAAVALIGAGGIAVGLYGWLGGRAVAPAREEPFQTMRMTVLKSGPGLRLPVLSPDGRYLGYEVQSNGQWSVFVRQVATGSDVQVIAPQGTEIRGLSFSPDGNYLYYLGLDPETPLYKSLFEIPSLGGAPRKCAFDVDTAVTFSPDGKRVAFVRGAPQRGEYLLVLLDLGSGTEEILATVKEPRQILLARPAWSPAGGRVAALVLDFEGGIRTQVTAFDITGKSHAVVASSNVPLVDGLSWLGEDGLAISGPEVGAGLTSQIWRLPSSGGRARRVTNDLNEYDEVTASADGKTIAAMRTSRSEELWMAPPDGKGELRQVTSGGREERIQGLAVADDGSILFAAPKERVQALWSMGPDGSGRRQITPDSLMVGNDQFYLRGKSILFTGAGIDLVPNIWRVDLDGGNLAQLTHGAGEFLAAVSQDGGQTLFVRTDSPKELWSLPTAGGDPSRLATDFEGRVVIVSPDGRLVCYSTYTQVGDRIRGTASCLPAGGGEPVARLTPPSGALKPRWAPDGKGVTFIKEVDGVSTIMKGPLGGGDPVLLVRSPSGTILDYDWSPSGNDLLFTVATEQTSNLWRWTVGAAAPKRQTDFRTGQVFDFAWTKDSRAFYFTQGNLSQEIVLIRGFE